MLCGFGDEMLVPALKDRSFDDRQGAFASGFYRMQGLLRVVRDLCQPSHFQGTAAATRAIFELSVEISLLHGDRIPNGVKRFYAFTEVARYRASQKLVRFYDEHPDLDDSKAAPARNNLAIPDVAAEMERLVVELWGKTQKGRPRWPDRWSGLGLADEAARVEVRTEELYRLFSDHLSWQLHGSAAGIQRLSERNFFGMQIECRRLLNEIVPRAYYEAGLEMQLNLPDDFVAELKRVVKEAENVTLIDIRLQSLGRPSKLPDRGSQ